MLTIKKKNLIILAVSFFLLFFLLSSISVLRAPFLNTLKFPLNILTFFRREAGAIVFYHRNFKENEILNKQVDFLRNKLNSQNELILENSRLKKLLSFKQKSPLRLTAARVIGQSADSWSANLIIDKGRFNGIRQGMTAVTFLGLVGRISEAQEFISKVMLITDPNIGISAIDQRSRQEGLVSGTLGVNLIMRYLPEEPDIKINDTIITSGLNSAYPKGLLIGTVSAIAREFSGLSSYAIIKPAVNLSDIEEVLIIIP